MTSPSGHETSTSNAQKASETPGRLDPSQYAALRHLVELAEQAIDGPQTMLAVADDSGEWRWIGGEHLEVSEICRDRLVAAILGFDIPPTPADEGDQAPHIVEDVLVLGEDQPRLRWVAARIQRRGALIACDWEPWEPDKQVCSLLFGFAQSIAHEFRRQDQVAGTRPLSSNDSFRNLIINSAQDGVVGLDLDGCCRFVNETAAELLHCDPDSLMRIDASSLFEITDPSTPKDILQFRNGDAIRRAEALLHRRDEEQLPIELTILPNVESSGEITGAIVRFADLSEQKAAAAAARHSEARHQAFLEMTLDSIVTIDRHGTIQEFNLAAEETFRCSASEVLGKDMAETLVPTPWREWFRSAFRTYANAGGGPLNGRRVQMNAMHSDGTPFPAEITITRLPADHDWIFTLYIHDLTEHRWNERRRATRYAVTRVLAESDIPSEALPQVLQKICQGLEWDWAALWTRDPETNQMHIDIAWCDDSVNAEALETASRDKTFEPGEGLIGEVWSNQHAVWVHDVQESGLYRRASASRACNFHTAAAMPIIGQEDVIGVVEFHSRRMREPDPEMMRMMESVGSQIGQYVERKRVEEERVQLLEREQTARAEAEAAERRLAFLAEASAQLSATLEYETTLSNVARLAVPRLADYCAIDMLYDDGQIRALELADIDPEKEAIGRDIRVHYPIDPESDHPVAQVMRSARPILYSEVDDDVLRLFTGDDEAYFETMRNIGVDSSMYVPLVARGRTIGVISFVASESGHRYGASDLALAQELTRRAALAIDNARLYREAQDAVRVREEFLSIASHELKTPLTTVKGYSQILSRLLRRSSIDRDRLIHLADQLQDQLGRFETLIADLLDISRIQQGGLELRPETTDLVEVTRKVISRFDYSGDSSPRHQFAFHGPDSYTGYWDPDRLDQVLTNLVSNAVKYSPEGGVIDIRIEPHEDDEVELSVTDQGIGIPHEEQAQLFQPFARSETVQRAISGVGLGLYISHQIVNRHGGTIWLESEPDEGSRFALRLPREYLALTQPRDGNGKNEST